MPKNDEIDQLLAPWSPAERPPADAEGRREWLNQRILTPRVDDGYARLRRRPSHGSARGTPYVPPAPLLPIDDE